MMFTYRQTKYGLLLTIFAVGAIATIGLATTMDYSAENVVDSFAGLFEEKSNDLFSYADDGGGMPSSYADDGGGMPS